MVINLSTEQKVAIAQQLADIIYEEMLKKVKDKKTTNTPKNSKIKIAN